MSLKMRKIQDIYREATLITTNFKLNIYLYILKHGPTINVEKIDFLNKKSLNEMQGNESSRENFALMTYHCYLPFFHTITPSFFSGDATL